MNNQIKILYVCTILVLCTLYAAQPIQPLFQEKLALTNFQAAVFTTVIMFPLGIAPILYGYILESISPRSMLVFSMLFLGILEIVFSLNSDYIILLLLRALQGFVIPAALTSLISYISVKSTTDKVQQAVGNYIAITIVGGFLARFLSGLSSQYFGWQPFFFFVGVMLIVFSLFLSRTSKETKINYIKPTAKEIGNVLRVRHNKLIYISMFFVFFVFQAVLNFIPFELKNLEHGVNEGKIGLIYIGYAIGVLISVNATKIIKFCVNEKNAMIVGVLIFAAGVGLFHIKTFWIMLFSMFVFCSGMFTIHSIATGYVNSLAKEHKGIANGLYLAFYYAGGTLGTFLPSFIYQGFGWDILLNILFFILMFTLLILYSLNKKAYM